MCSDTTLHRIHLPELAMPAVTVMFQNPTVELRMFNKYDFGIVFLHIYKNLEIKINQSC